MEPESEDSEKKGEKKLEKHKKYKPWNKEQKKRYLEFLIANRSKLDGVRITKNVTELMKQHVGTEETGESCLKKHWNMKIKYKTYDGIIKHLITKFRLEKTDQEFVVWAENERRKFKQVKEIEMPQLFCKIKKQLSMEDEAVRILFSNLDIQKISIQSLIQARNSSNLLLCQNDNSRAKIFNFQPQNLLNDPIKQNQNNLDKVKLRSKESTGQASLQKNHQQISSSQAIKEARINWTQAQRLKFYVFVLKYRQTFRHRLKFIDPEKQYTSNIFQKMSEFVGTKTRQECNSEYNRLIRRIQDFDQAIQNLGNKLFASENQIQKEIQRVEALYQTHRQSEFNAFNNQKYTKLKILEGNLTVLKEMLTRKLFERDQVPLLSDGQSGQKNSILSVGDCEDNFLKKDDQVQSSKVYNNTRQLKYCFEMQIPILLELLFQEENTEFDSRVQKTSKYRVDLEKKPKIKAQINSSSSRFQLQQTKSSRTRNRQSDIFQEDNQEKQKEKKFESENLSKVGNIKIEKQNIKQRMIELQKPIHQKNELLLGKTNKKIIRVRSFNQTMWSISQNVKFFTFLMANRQIFQKQEKLTAIHATMLANFLGKSKNYDQLYSHFAYLIDKNKNKFSEMMRNEIARFGLSYDLIELRKTLCQQTRILKEKRGLYDLTVESVPTLMLIEKEKFDLDQILNQISKMDFLFKVKAFFHRNESLKEQEAIEDRDRKREQESLIQQNPEEQKEWLKSKGEDDSKLSDNNNLFQARMQFKVSLGKYTKQEQVRLKEIIRNKSIKIKINQILKFYSK